MGRYDLTEFEWQVIASLSGSYRNNHGKLIRQWRPLRLDEFQRWQTRRGKHPELRAFSTNRNRHKAGSASRAKDTGPRLLGPSRKNASAELMPLRNLGTTLISLSYNLGLSASGWRRHRATPVIISNRIKRLRTFGQPQKNP